MSRKVEFSPAATGSPSLVVRKRSYLSTQHLSAAQMLVEKAKEIEAIYKRGEAPRPVDDFRNDYRSFVIASLFCSVAFLDARINEFLSDLEGCDCEKFDANVVATAVTFLKQDLVMLDRGRLESMATVPLGVNR
ncbi:MAG: hypothetical protein ACE5FG_03340 [Myxococcota bacterium]